MKKLQFLFGIVLAVLVFSSNTTQNSLTGSQVMQKVYERPKGNDTQGELTMVLINKQGEQRTRKLKQYIKDDGKIEKKIMFFISPADVKNTSFMNWSYASGKADDQWIYLPALKKTKRISSESKSDYFMGSDFTYDDLGDRHPSMDNHKILKEETVDGKACFVVESTPKDKSYMYSKTITWVMKDNYIGLKRDFYDKNGKLLKTLNIEKFEKINGFWTILKTNMNNVQKNHKTTMEFTNVKINVGIADSKFTERTMTTGE